MDSIPITLLVAEELTLMREGLVRLCQEAPGCSVVAQCGDGAEALRQIQRCAPDLAVIDLNLGDIYSLELVRRSHEAGFNTRFVVLSTRRDRKTAVECVRAGVTGYVLKGGPLEHLHHAIQQSTSGAVYVSPLIDMDHGGYSATEERDPLETLSAREHQVFSLLIEGVRAKEIAARLDLSPKTVDTYRASLMRKLDIHDVAGLVKFAIHRELTSVRC
ncbi:MAG: response regulator transcription factor [Acidobacteria bacterium]|nr:response regulator transcription factor [Acidobacteriota bacterium]